jgi:hypothetical protein
VLVDTSAEPGLQPDDYYKEPDWEEIRHRREEDWRQYQLWEQQQREHLNDQSKVAPDENLSDESEKTKDRWTFKKFLWTIKKFFKSFFTKK